MKNWKTTLAGIVTAVGIALQQSEDETLKLIGTIVIAAGALALGATAADKKKVG